MKKKNDSLSTGGKVAVAGAGVLALAAASYFFFGPEGKKNRDNLQSWMIKMKGEVIEKLEGAEEVTEALYNKVVDAVAAKYVKAGKISEQELQMFAAMLKQQWKGIVRTHSKKTGAKPVAKKAPAKTVAKKTAKK